VISNAVDHLKEGSCSYLFMDWRHERELQAAAKRCKLTQLNLCIWDKCVGGMGSLYRSQHELIYVYRKGAQSHRNNIMLGKYGRNRTNVWQYPSANMSKEGREALKDHPTPKPVAMIADIFRDVTKPGDLVFDPFLGGGTAIIAAERTRRHCYGIELDPHYVDATVRRWQKYTNQEAVHAETGRTFSEHELRLHKKSLRNQKGGAK
jgi:DNA modification methylase